MPIQNSRCTWLWVLLIASSPLALAQKFSGLANTPQMGWNSWNKFGCNVSEQLIRETADAMVSSGMKQAGYQYVNIDDCWHGERDARGFIQANAQRFPCLLYTSPSPRDRQK